MSPMLCLCREQGFRSPCPMHDEYLEYVRDQGMLSYPIDIDAPVS